MIWDLIEQSQFDKHFQDPSLKIVTLLLDQNIITELKNQNPKLLEYLNEHKQSFIQELIEYTVIMPLESEGYDRGHKLPYISSQLLAINSELIYAQFFKQGIEQSSNTFWNQLINFLETPAAHSQVLMGYFQKVINNLYNGNNIKTTKVIAFHLNKFLPLLNNGSIGDIIKNCIILLTTPEGVVLEERLYIVSKVIEILVSGSEEVKAITSDILSQIIHKFQAFSSGDAILAFILNSKTLLEIYKIENSSAINAFLVSLLKKSQQKITNQKDEIVPILTMPTEHYKQLQQYLVKQVKLISDLSNTNEYLTNQSRITIRKSNKKIYSLLNLICLAIQMKLTKFITGELINNLWNLVVLYPYNSILQVIILKIFGNIYRHQDKQTNNLFLNHFESYMLQLAKQNLQMFRPFIFTVWKETSCLERVTTDEHLLNSYNELVQKEFTPLMKYEINKNTIQHYQSVNHKLIVDEQDKTNTEAGIKPGQIIELNQQINQQLPVAALDDFTSIELQQKTKDQFNFFQSWSVSEPKEVKKQQKTDLFGDFASFF